MAAQYRPSSRTEVQNTSWLPACWKLLPPEPSKRTELPTQPRQDLTVDLLGPLPAGEYLLVAVDYFSRVFEEVVTKSVTSGKMISCLEAMFATQTLSIKTGNGP